MQVFLDTANVEEIARGVALGCVSGVTTNPTIVAREGKSLAKCVADIVAVDRGLTLLLEAVSPEASGLVAEARELVQMADNVVVKLPMSPAGLQAAKVLSDQAIRTAVTLVFSASQAVLAACAGATFVAPFVGRLDDINSDGVRLVRSIKEVFVAHGVRTGIVAASIRSPQSVPELFGAGSDIVTMPCSVLEKMLQHPLTEAGLRQFDADWKKVPS